MNTARLKKQDGNFEIVSAIDFEVKLESNSSLRDCLYCTDCNARITFTKLHYRNGTKVDAIFRDLKHGKHDENCSLASDYNISRTGKNGTINPTSLAKFDGIADMFRKRKTTTDTPPPEPNDDKETKNELGNKSKYTSRDGAVASKRSGLVNILGKLVNGHEIDVINLDNKQYDVIKICDISEDDLGQNNAFWGKFKLFSPKAGSYYISVIDEFRPHDGITIQITELLYKLIDENIKNEEKYFLLLTGTFKLNTAENTKNKFKVFAGEKSKICFI